MVPVSRSAFCLAGLAALALGGDAVAGPDAPRMVVELFTSQGCSSCPPADKLLGDIARDPGVLAVSMPVDYWDYLGWKDTLADRAFTERQKAYGEARGDRQIYTPQAVVDGVVHAVGSNLDAIASAEKAGSSRGALSVPVSVETDGKMIRVRVAAGKPSARATVLLVPIKKQMEVAIGRGENKGRTVTYTNVARNVMPLGAWTGEARTYEIPVSSVSKASGCDTYVAFVQEGDPARPGVILGAAKAASF